MLIYGTASDASRFVTFESRDVKLQNVFKAVDLIKTIMLKTIHETFSTKRLRNSHLIQNVGENSRERR